MAWFRAGWRMALLAGWSVACGHDWTLRGDASDVVVDDGAGPPDGSDADADGGCAPPRIDCGGMCVDPATDPAHCGECWRVCDPPNGRGACTAGECRVTCDPGWIDADGAAANGCEYFCTPAGDAEFPDRTCANGLDDDCDTRADAADRDCAACVPEFCNSLDDDCDGLTDEDFDLDFDPLHCGACNHACPRRPHAGPACTLGGCDVACAPGWADADRNPANGCEAPCVPVSDAVEAACDGRDDDCDGLTDEEWRPTGFCGVSLCTRSELCYHGEEVCRPRPPPAALDTTCDGIDDDCDGLTDDEADCACTGDEDCNDSNPCTVDDCGPDAVCRITAVADGTSCPAGRCCGRACVGDTSETCNGRDDDCDGSTDEGFPCLAGAEVSCVTSCGSAGSGRCTAACALPSGLDCWPPGETCNGLDDNCDGRCDDGFACCLGATRACDAGSGAEGVQSCGPGCTWSACTATTDPCNGEDDDRDTRCDQEFECCRGATDWRACPCGGSEFRTCDETCAWGPFGGCPAAECTPGRSEPCETWCGSLGRRFCEPSCTWGACAPSAETCNGVDDDCNGWPDDGFECPAGTVAGCTNGCGRPGSRSCDSSCTWGPCLPAGTSVLCFVCAEDPYYLPSSAPYCGELSLTDCSFVDATRVTDYACIETLDSWRRTYCCP